MSHLVPLFSLLPSALLQHLWQSTVFCAMMWGAAALLRANTPALRFRLWMASSVKFLLPLSLLIGAGQYLRPAESRAVAASAFSIVIEGPGAARLGPSAAPQVPHPVRSTGVGILSLLLPAVWIAGTFILIGVWSARYLSMRRIARLGASQQPVAAEHGRGGRTVPVVFTTERLEPGVFGLFRPVLLLPQGIAERLSATELQAILAHELEHVRRRDNLSAALHMLVQAAFWFHPAVWWIGGRMVEEREAACDAAVVRHESAEAYAQGILKVCRFYVEQPMACVPGVTGANLKKRIARIVSGELGHALSLRGRAVLITATAISMAVPLGYGVLHPRAVHAAAVDVLQPQLAASLLAAVPVFSAGLNAATRDPELAAPGTGLGAVRITRSSVYAAGKGFRLSPGHFQATNHTLTELIAFSYGVHPAQILEGPRWMDTETYTLDGRTPGDMPPSEARLKAMLRQTLAEKFGLRLHTGRQNEHAYLMTVSEDGPHLTRNETNPNGLPGLQLLRPGVLLAQNATVADFVEVAQSMMLDRPLIDQTGLKGRWDFSMHWRPDAQTYREINMDQPLRDDGDTSPPPLQAIREQLGLRVVPATVPLNVLVVERADRPRVAQENGDVVNIR